MSQFSQYNTNLSKKEQEQFSKYLHICEQLLTHTSPPLVRSSSIETDEIFKTPIPRTVYVRIFQKVLHIYGFKQEIRVEPRSSIYDGKYL